MSALGAATAVDEPASLFSEAPQLPVPEQFCEVEVSVQCNGARCRFAIDSRDCHLLFIHWEVGCLLGVRDQKKTI